jgi:hypothetical protein
MSRTNPHVPNWPKPHRTKGAALSRRDAEKRLGMGHNSASVLLKRTRDGANVAVPFPEPEGFAVPYTGYRRPQLYWWERDIIRYGRRAGWLDANDNPINTPKETR